MSVHLFGVRHHGPGSARSLLDALSTLCPDIILIEGPPEAESLLPMVAHPEMNPPVALLVYAVNDLKKAVFYPFASFSPEWQAIKYGLAQETELRFFDLAQKYWLAIDKEENKQEPDNEAETSVVLPAALDPLDYLARVVGLDTGEEWWERLVEERCGDDSVFEAICEAMTALRTDPEISKKRSSSQYLEILREASMRNGIRNAQKQGYQRIAVVCGAWHTPALKDLDSEIEDNKVLANLAKVDVNITWVPWSYGHLARVSGYGAGIESPGWYEHIWLSPQDCSTRWLGQVAALLRDEDLDASAAQVIDAVRLADALAAMRDRARPGLRELNQAALTVFCFGNDLPLQLIQKRLVVGDRLGNVPENAPVVPLQQDLLRLQKSLRLPVMTDSKTYDLDLRKEVDLKRSSLLHRLNILGISWGTLGRVSGAKGTFHELWELKWDPVFSVKLVEASVWGNTVAEAAANLIRYRVDKAELLSQVTALLDQVLLADLPEVTADVLQALQAKTAVSSDVVDLMDAVPHLGRALRYGTVRQTSGSRAIDVEVIESLVVGLVGRICIGLALACVSLDDDSARQMLERIDAVHGSIKLVQLAELEISWQRTLRVLMDKTGLHGLLAGRICRYLFDEGVIEVDDVVLRLQQVLSPGVSPLQAAAWLEGLLSGSGFLLIHDHVLRSVLDEWLGSLSEENFMAALPLLRRIFSTFSHPERRHLGELVAKREKASSGRQAVMGVDIERADAILPMLAMLLGLENQE